MKLYLIRHAETTWNKMGFLGITDADLSNNGIEQAKTLALKFRDKPIEVIYSSMLKRSIKTAEEISKLKKLNLIKRPELNEVNFGIFEELTIEEAKEKFPEIFNIRLKNKWNYKIPKGESYEEAYKRVLPFIDKIFSEHKDFKTVIAVTHATILKILYTKISNKPLEEVEKYYWGTCSYFAIEKNKNKFEIVETSFPIKFK